jgi:hypothetical protein
MKDELAAAHRFSARIPPTRAYLRGLRDGLANGVTPARDCWSGIGDALQI